MILVTGGTGFLGSHLIRTLVQAGKPVKALYRKHIPDQLADVRDKVMWVKGDVLDVTALEEAMEDVTHVYHCAAVVSFNPIHKYEMLKINIEGTSNIVNLCIDFNIQKLVHVSSVASLGRAKEMKEISEENSWEESKNNSAYALSKHLSEMEVWRGIAEGLNAVMVNPSIILGSGYWGDGSGALLKNAWKEFPFYTQGINGFVDVEDVVKAMVMLMESDITKHRFVLSAANWSYRDLFTKMAEGLHKKPPHIAAKPRMAALVWRVEKLKSFITGKPALITRETARTAQLKVFYNSDKITKMLPGYTFKPLDQTIREISAKYLEYKKTN
ncbi:NAD-dependent epimerase/dehydratase family protein [Chitinophaga sedimenti]|uniref:NAD-dependent epimerase/dehydratase family protein n=1 Tax=Chitinophaga sedimenti TaxID=2033606 RepID=UPI0020042942|nr:NAD-dependent epimerase/dehydratase family protein [Chitinophaga sedimenti]MCK7558555.1 NAD-dependent epimerase/dehydratase family protein [Chitinophaga sedimenti]